MPSAFYHVTGSESSWEDKTRDEAEPEDLPGFVRYLHLANDRTALLNAMKPYLSSSRRDKMDKAMRIARLAEIAELAAGEFGGSEDV